MTGWRPSPRRAGGGVDDGDALRMPAGRGGGGGGRPARCFRPGRPGENREHAPRTGPADESVRGAVRADTTDQIHSSPRLPRPASGFAAQRPGSSHDLVDLPPSASGSRHARSKTVRPCFPDPTPVHSARSRRRNRPSRTIPAAVTGTTSKPKQHGRSMKRSATASTMSFLPRYMVRSRGEPAAAAPSVTQRERTIGISSTSSTPGCSSVVEPPPPRARRCRGRATTRALVGSHRRAMWLGFRLRPARPTKDSSPRGRSCRATTIFASAKHMADAAPSWPRKWLRQDRREEPRSRVAPQPSGSVGTRPRLRPRGRRGGAPR